MRHLGAGKYYRDAGAWSIDTRFENGKIFTVDYYDSPILDNIELIPTTEKKWRKSNQGYVPSNNVIYLIKHKKLNY